MASPDPARVPAAVTEPAPNRLQQMRPAAIVALLALVGAALLLTASQVSWATVYSIDPLGAGRKSSTASGLDWSPMIMVGAIVLIIAFIGALAFRGWLLRIAGIAVAVASVLAMVPAISMLTGSDQTDYASKVTTIPDRNLPESVETHSWPAILVILGGGIGVGAAVLMMRLANRRRGGTMSTKYESPAVRRAELEREVFAQQAVAQQEAQQEAVTSSTEPAQPGSTKAIQNERLLWDALDAGEDPTTAGATGDPEPGESDAK